MSHATHATAATTPVTDDSGTASEEDSLQARHCRALDELIEEVMPDSWAGHDRLEEDNYPYTRETGPQQKRDPAA